MTQAEHDLIVEMIKDVKKDVKDVGEKLEGLFRNGPINALCERTKAVETTQKFIIAIGGAVSLIVLEQLIHRIFNIL